MPEISKTSVRGLDETYVPHAEGTGIDRALISNAKGIDLDTLYETVKGSPEVDACIQAITEDIMADGWKFEGGKNKVGDVKKFVDKSKFFKVLTNAIWDLMITGNAYILKLNVAEEKINEGDKLVVYGHLNALKKVFRKD